MTWVALGVGSNIDAANNLKRCLGELLLHFGDMALSSVFESEAVGFSGDNFLNMAVAFETGLSLAELSDQLKDIEDKFGRDRSRPRFSGRTMDLDILLYGGTAGRHAGIELPRPEITENAYVLWPLSQIAGDRVMPGMDKTIARLWEGFDKDAQNLWPVDFKWHGRKISSGTR